MRPDPPDEQAPALRIGRLPELAASLSPDLQDTCHRIFQVTRSTGRLAAPETMHGWIRDHFGSVEAVEAQTVVKVLNLVTLEGSLFNSLRASRPVAARVSGDPRQAIEESRGDPFCRPLEGTPADPFGRVRGQHAVTASNVAKYDAHHGVVIFDEHDPLALTEAAVADYLSVGRQWAEEVVRVDPEARYFLFMWNALWKSGASIIHGHAQVACTRGSHYAKVEQLRRAAVAYEREHGTNYFSDLDAVHSALGLSVGYEGATVLASLTPVKEREVWIVTGSLRPPLSAALYRVLDCFVSDLGVTSFNVAIQMPPLGEPDESWAGFPVVTRVVDRGDPMNRTSDVGAMELYAASVISTDPFDVISALRSRLFRP